MFASPCGSNPWICRNTLSLSPGLWKPVHSVFLPLVIIIAALGVSGCQSVDGIPPIPATPRQPVTNVYHGVEVIDDYRWLEDRDDPAVREWTDAQSSRTRALLDRIQAREPIHHRLEKLHGEESPNYYYLQYRGGVLFALKSQPPLEQSLLVTLESPDDPGSERVILDPNLLDTSGTTAIDFYVPGREARMVAVSLSQKGSEIGDVHVYDVATGQELGDVIPRVNGPTAGGSVAWTADGSGFYYTRYPRTGERPAEDMSFYQQIYFHKLGTPTADDTYTIGREFPRIAEIELETTEDCRYTLATVANGDGGEYAHYLLTPDNRWAQITQFEDKITHGTFAPDNSLVLLSTKNAPLGKILRLAPGVTDLARAAVVVPESEAVIRYAVPTKTKIYVVDVIGGPSQIRVCDLDGNNPGSIPIQPVSAIYELVSFGEDTVLFRNTSYIDPAKWYVYDPTTARIRPTALVKASPADFSDAEVVREFAVSPDGTQVPMNIIRRKGIELDGTNPTILTGYGGFGLGQSPDFNPARSVWLDQGGVYVVANLRGGNEFGEPWHQTGMLTNKQNVFDDFTACARHLIERGYTNPARLAIQGGSNGGLLVGAAMTQHPELFGAVVAWVGLFDMLRFELEPNGVFNVTEYGTVADSAQFAALYAYSPYHHVVDGTEYPDILMLAGEHDGRVNPSNSRKMTARLQAVSGPQAQVLLWMSSSSGHGVGKTFSERIALDADVFAFLFDRLEMSYQSDLPPMK